MPCAGVQVSELDRREVARPVENCRLTLCSVLLPRADVVNKVRYLHTKVEPLSTTAMTLSGSTQQGVGERVGRTRGKWEVDGRR